jgi:hypothetical protein
MSMDKASKPKVAVALAAFNGASWLDEQIESILCQREVEVTIFVSSDSSTDGTEELLTVKSKAEPRLIVLPEAGPFGGAARSFFWLVCDLDLTGFAYLALGREGPHLAARQAVPRLSDHCRRTGGCLFMQCGGLLTRRS